MRDSVPSARYSSGCNVLHLWSISLIPTLESTDSMILQCNVLYLVYLIERGVEDILHEGL